MLGNKMAGLKMKKNLLIRKFANKWKKKSDLSSALGKVEKKLMEERKAAEAQAKAHNDLVLKVKRLEKELIESKKFLSSKESEFKMEIEKIKASNQEQIAILEEQAKKLKQDVDEASNKKGTLEEETKQVVKRLVDKVEAKNDLLHRARIRVAKLEAERNVLKKVEQYRSREATIAEEAASEAERQVLALTKLRKQVEKDTDEMDNLEVLKHSFDPDIMVMTHRKQAMQEQQMEYLRKLQGQHMHKEFPEMIIDAYASPPADKDSNKSLFEKGNGTFGNGNTFDVISGIRRSRPNSPPEPMASNETVPNRRVSPTGLETKVENRNGAKHSGMDAIYPTQLHQDDHAKLAYLSRLQWRYRTQEKKFTLQKMLFKFRAHGIQIYGQKRTTQS